MTDIVNIYDAKTQLSRLVDRAAAGEDILIARAGKPVARLVALEGAAPRQPGLLRGLAIPDALFAPLDADEATLWE
jgi:prevent-host-death family protein